MEPIRRGRFTARLASGEADLARVLALRAQAFGRAPGVGDGDAFDARCDHVMVLEADRLALCFRAQVLAAADLGRSYSGQFYDLGPLTGAQGPVVEIGRFCMAPGGGPDPLRLAWAAMVRIVDAAGARLMIGCSSFAGDDWRKHRAGLALLARDHLGPAALRPLERAGEVLRFADLAGPVGDPRAALAALPPLLRSYLALGGWVGDHAVADRDLDTLHVFTCVAVKEVPAARAQSLRALALEGGPGGQPPDPRDI